jgi:hypothetical protein
LGPRDRATTMLYARLMAVVRPEPESRIALPDTMRACSVFVFVVKPSPFQDFDKRNKRATRVKLSA